MIPPPDPLTSERDALGVSGSGAQLEAALDHFGVDVADRVCLDGGAAVGGFTAALLRRDAAFVYAVDVAPGLLPRRLAQDARVLDLGLTNLLLLTELPRALPTVVTVDVSFVSLRTLLPRVVRLAAPAADVVCVFKPQFEPTDTVLTRHRGAVEANATAAVEDFRAWAAHVFHEYVGGPLLAPRVANAGGRIFVHLRLNAT